MKITKEQKQAIYKAMDVLVDIEKTAWDEFVSKEWDFTSKEAKLVETADKAWWKLRELWKFY